MIRSMHVIIAIGIIFSFCSSNARADGDAAKGKRVFNKCKSCHELTKKKNKIGPHLVGIIGRKAGSVEGFKYSPAMKNANIVWDEKTINAYIINPKKFVPGNKMTLPPIKKEDQRKDLIEYIKAEQKK